MHTLLFRDACRHFSTSYSRSSTAAFSSSISWLSAWEGFQRVKWHMGWLGGMPVFVETKLLCIHECNQDTQRSGMQAVMVRPAGQWAKKNIGYPTEHTTIGNGFSVGTCLSVSLHKARRISSLLRGRCYKHKQKWKKNWQFFIPVERSKDTDPPCCSEHQGLMDTSTERQ